MQSSQHLQNSVKSSCSRYELWLPANLASIVQVEAGRLWTGDYILSVVPMPVQPKTLPGGFQDLQTEGRRMVRMKVKETNPSCITKVVRRYSHIHSVIPFKHMRKKKLARHRHPTKI